MARGTAESNKARKSPVAKPWRSFYEEQLDAATVGYLADKAAR